jgi:hypothetical protein
MLPSASREPTTVSCGYCDTHIDMQTGVHIATFVPVTSVPVVFCSRDCYVHWQSACCAWCGMSAERGFLSTTILNTLKEPIQFCDVTHLENWQANQRQTPR